MKKIISIIAVNLVLLLCVLALLETGLYIQHKKHYPEIRYIIKKFPYDNILEAYKLAPQEGKDYKTAPIILAGCSYAYGQDINRTQSLGYKLSDYTKKPIYNYSLPGKGLQNTLYMISHGFFDPDLKPDNVIYVFMYDQIRRMYSTVCLHDYTGFPVYKIDKKGNVVLKKNYYPLYKQLYTYYFFNNIYLIYFDSKNIKKHSKDVNAYFKAINNEVKKLYPDAKFSVLMYDDGGNNYGLDLKPSEEAGINIIHTDDLSPACLSNLRYHVDENNFHPNEMAWNALIPGLVSKLDIKNNPKKAKAEQKAKTNNSSNNKVKTDKQPAKRKTEKGNKSPDSFKPDKSICPACWD